MAFEDELRDFLENRLEAFDPSIDLAANSAAQVQIIEPTIDRFGEDPFSVDIPTFLRERLVQEFPELAADNAGLLEDLFTKPLQLILEPFKRAIETTRLNQSAENASLMSTDEADALGANFFQDREEGDFASGPVRVYFSAPTTVRITQDREFSSRSGLSYFPVDSVFIQSSQMLFNRDGSLFFVDVTVRAQETGDEYNVASGEIISVADVEGVIKVSNLSAFTTGQPSQTNEEYLGGIPEALTERSLVTTRGVSTRVPDVFGTQIRALQVVGAGEDGMNRDILRGTGEGFLHLVGRCSFFGAWVIVGEVVYRDDGVEDNVTIQAGDTIRLILSVADDPTRKVYPATILDLVSVGVGTTSEKHILILDRTLDTLIGDSSASAAGTPVVSVLKEGFITISGRPGGISEFQTVADGSVHLGGHTDVFVRPSADVEKEAVLPNLTDGEPLLALLDLSVTADDNLVSTATDLVGSEILPGDVVVLETGTSAGTYKILSVGSPDSSTQMRVDALFEVSESSLRGRVFRKITIDLVEPKVPKIPFTSSPVNDLRMTVGSKLFRLDSTDIQSFGATTGDTIRVLDGPNAGDYLITGFDTVLGGQGPIVDQAAAATTAGVQYEVFTISDGLEFPLVRVKSLEILDSTNQGTGITVPYGDAVDVRPLCDFEGAGTSVRVLTKDIIVFPDAEVLPAGEGWGADGTGLAETFATSTSATDDARYSKGIADADGRVRTATSSGTITTAEHNLPPFLYNGRRDTIMAFTTRENPDFTVPLGPGSTHRTSDIAEASIGDSLVILDGPNAGSYTIQDLRVLDMWYKSGDGQRRIALVQLDQELPVDPLKAVIDYIGDASGTTGVVPVTAEELASGIEDATIFFSSGFWNTAIITKLIDTINHPSQLGAATITADEAESLLLGLAASGYEIGPSAKGTLRVFFQEPVSAQFSFGEDPTFFQAVNNPELRYRISPTLDEAQIFPQNQELQPPSEWNRNLVLHTADRKNIYLGSGSAFAKRGIRDGDILEYYRAHNDRNARLNMQSSWMCVTKAGSNVVRAILPPDDGNSKPPRNNILIEEGHLFFIDSGPDIGAYVITEVISSDLSTDPGNVEFKVDRIMTHATDVFPAEHDRDFQSIPRAFVTTADNVFPMTFSGGETLKVDYGTSLFAPTTYTFTFPATTYNTIGDLITALNGDVGFVGASPRFEALADGDKVVLRTSQIDGPAESLEVDATSTGIGGSLLQFDGTEHGKSRRTTTTLAGTKRIYGTKLTFSAPDLWAVDQWVSIYAAREGGALLTDDALVEAGEDEAYLGTYKVVSVGTQAGGPFDGDPYVELDRSVDFPLTVEVRWIRHGEPDTTPADTTGGGKELSQNYVRCRFYKEVAERTVVSIPWLTATNNPLLGVDDLPPPTIAAGDEPEQLVTADDPISGELGWGHKMPYRILRDDVVRISSTEMESNRDGALYYLDIPVVGLGTNQDLNIDVSTGLQLEGNYNVDGYTLRVQDEIFVFSEDEQTSIVLPANVLPVGSTPDLDNRTNLAGQNLQINYDNADLIANIQQFFDSPLDRVVVANVLVRHFLPSYVILDATYSGGKAPDVVASELINYINNIDPNINELSSDEVAKIIRQQGASQVQQPIRLIVLTHGVDRRIRGTQSFNIIGGAGLPTFSGTFKQTYFIAGPDTSAEEDRPDGEQVFLDRL